MKGVKIGLKCHFNRQMIADSKNIWFLNNIFLDKGDNFLLPV